MASDFPDASWMEIVGAALFFIALVHTFSTKFFEELARRHPTHAGLFYLLGEVEVVFGLWATVMVAFMAMLTGGAQAAEYAGSRQYTEPLFVFVVMVIAASRPVLELVRAAMQAIARMVPLPDTVVLLWLGLAVVPLVGSVITEPAAMTLAALMLRPLVFTKAMREPQKYAALGVLFVNVSIGGTLTSYAAPPVLMVASAWQWDSAFMLRNFGWKAALAVCLNATLLVVWLRPYLPRPMTGASVGPSVPWTVSLVHCAFLAVVIALGHFPVLFLGLFLFFLGYAHAYPQHQSPLILKEALLVGFFLAGLVVLGGMQQWWLQPIVSGLRPAALFVGAMGLTAITDNAALTYLGSLIEGISDASKYMLVAGAVAGGGLTVIANAPNLAGAALLRPGFADGAIRAGGLLAGAALPTAVAAMAFFWL